MEEAKVFAPNKPNVIHEVIDGEAVIVNLKNGTYYSIDKVGAELWDYIDKGFSVPTIIERLQARYVGSPESISQSVEKLITQFQSENLIVPKNGGHAEDAATNGMEQKASGNGEETEEKLPFEEPKLEKYSDMEDLLLLDPIHDVEEEGWPRANANKEEDEKVK